MLAALIDFCIIDNLPTDQSPIFKKVVNLCGEEVASLLVEERECVICSHPPPNDEVKSDGRYSRAPA